MEPIDPTATVAVLESGARTIDAGTQLFERILPSSDPSALAVDDRARDLLATADGRWQYVLVFVLAAIPLLEILLVIPVGVALGLDPVAVAVLAFAGNLLPVYGIVVGFDRLSTWLGRRREEGQPSSRRRRAKRLWNRYGLPGLALLAPIATGVHLGAAIAVGLGARRDATLAWMTASIALWTVAITVAAVTGLSLLS